MRWWTQMDEEKMSIIKKNSKRRGMRRKNRRKLLCAFRDRFCCCCWGWVAILPTNHFSAAEKYFRYFALRIFSGRIFQRFLCSSFHDGVFFIEQKNASNLLFQFEDYQRSNQISTENHKDSFRRSILIFRCGRCRRMCTISSYIKTQK